MRILHVLVAVICVTGLGTLAAAQNAPAAGSDDSAGRTTPAPAVSAIAGMESDTEGGATQDLPPIPAFLGGQQNSLALTTEMERSNYLRGGVNVGAGYNDNALLAPVGQEGNFTYSVFPNIAIERTTSRTKLSLAYGGGLTVNQRLSNNDQGSHHFTFDSVFRLSPHVDLHASETFSLIAGIFGAGAGSNFQTGGQNGTIITPLANQRTSATVVETNYHFALKDLVGVSGSFYDLHFSDVSTGAGTLTNTQTASGAAFWLHELFHGDWAGVSYKFDRITYDPTGETRVQTIAFTDTLDLGRRIHINGFVGPEFSQNDGVAADGGTGQASSFSSWGVSGGIDAGWQSARTSVTGGYSKRVSDGGGVLGTVRLQSAHGGVRRELATGWALKIEATYGSNQAVTLSPAEATTAKKIQTTSVGATLERNIGRSVGFQLGYFHDFQDQSGSQDATLNYNTDRNRVMVTLSYQWAKPLGR